MLSKCFAAKNLLKKPQSLMATSMANRGVYTDETRPYVFINEHTKVICQGMTGKHVSRIHMKTYQKLREFSANLTHSTNQNIF